VLPDNGRLHNHELLLLLLLLLLLFILAASGFLSGGSGTTIRHNTQITHITQNYTPSSKEHSTQNYTNNKGHIIHSKYNANTITSTTI
jgi:cytoskeletal protein RodZ